MSTVVLSVPRISCEHCERTIHEALRAQEGVEEVAVDISAKTVLLRFDESKLTLDRVRDVLAQEEFPVAAVTPA